jgi:MFS transporter, PPP family, 3-phenylpropionic acid transporter
MPPIARATLFIMLLHLVLGAILPYLPVWLEETKGLTGAQIGLILASSSFGRILMGPLAAAWAEGRTDRRTPLIVFAAALAFGYALFEWMPAFWPIAITTFFTGIVFQCLMAFTEAATLRATATSRRWPYGRARAAASAAFVVASLAAGAGVQAFGIGAAYVWFVITTLLTLGCAFWLRADLVDNPVRTPIVARMAGGLGLFTRRGFVLGVAAAALIQASHAFYYGFSSTLWLAQGFSASTVGALWSIGVVVEVGFLAFLAPRLNQVRPEVLIAIGGLASAARWTVLSTSPDLWTTFAIQTLHAGTFAATHIGFMRLIEAETRSEQRATGQQLATSLAMSPVAGLATIGAGWLYDHVGVAGYWSGVGLAGLGTICALSLILFASRMNGPGRTAPEIRPH